MNPKLGNNVILTRTERLMMGNRPKNPANARNKNVLIVGGSGSGKTRFWIKPNLLQLHSSYVLTDLKGRIYITLMNSEGSFYISDIMNKAERRQIMGKADQTKITALYERLSIDDDLQGESSSIINQEPICKG